MDIENIFTYHAPSGNDLENYQAIREAGKLLARTILERTPRCADQAAATSYLVAAWPIQSPWSNSCRLSSSQF